MQSNRVCSACLAMLLAGLPAGAAAQALPPSDAAAALAALSAGAQPAQTTVQERMPVSFVLREVVLAGPSGYFSPERLQAVMAPFIGARIATAGTDVLASAINDLYATEGISFAQAWVVGADPVRGVVTLELFEARLGRIVTVSRRLSEAYLSRRLGLRSGILADTRLIGERLERLSLTDGLLADAGFSPGAEPGTTDLTIRFAEPPAVQGSVNMDNYGTDPENPRFTGKLVFNSPTGSGDTLAFNMLLDRNLHWLNASYIRPVGSEGTKLGVTLSGEWETDDGSLNREGFEQSLTFDVSHPLVLSPEKTLWLVASLEAFDDQASVLGVASRDQSGLAFSLSLSGGYNPGEGRGLAASWSIGVISGLYDDGIAGLENAAFGLLSASGQVSVAQGEWGRLSLVGNAQVATGDPIPLGFQFPVTSPKAVAGYPPGLSAGETGLWARAEIQAARPMGAGAVSLLPFAFVAAGQAFDRAPGGWQGQGVASAGGIGLSGRWGERASFDFQAAWPLSEVLGQGGDSEPSLHLNIAMTF